MKTSFKKTLALLLAAMTFALLLASCGEAETPAAPSGTVPSAAADVTETAAAYDAPETADFNGYDFRIAIKNARNTDHFVMIPSEQNGEVINDAVFLRNSRVSENYNIKISGVVDPDDTTADKVKTAVLAGDDYCDVALYGMRDHFTHAQEGYLLDVNTIDAFDFSQPWWDGKLLDSFRIYGQNYCFTGDLTTHDDLLILIMLYNTKLYEDYGFENSYDMVSGGTWTFDRFWGMAKTASVDLDGDGVMTFDDQWGFLTETAAWYYYSTGCGLMPLKPDSDGGYVFTLDDEKTYTIIEKTKAMVTNTDISYFANDGKVGIRSGTSVWDSVEGMFMDNLGLFKSGCFNDVTRYRDMSADFGILPMPKFDEAQESYYDLVTYHTDACVLPNTVTDPERSALILSALSYESMLTVNPCFYDIFLNEKLVRDEESKGMVDIILKTKVYDLNFTVQLSDLSKIMENISISRDDNFASQWASAKDSANAKLEQFLEYFRD